MFIWKSVYKSAIFLICKSCDFDYDLIKHTLSRSKWKVEYIFLTFVHFVSYPCCHWVISSNLNKSAVHLRANTQRQSKIHTHGQFRITNSPNKRRLWPGGGNLCRHRACTSLELDTYLLWGDSPNHCTATPQLIKFNWLKHDSRYNFASWRNNERKLFRGRKSTDINNLNQWWLHFL